MLALAVAATARLGQPSELVWGANNFLAPELQTQDSMFRFLVILVNSSAEL